MWGADATQLQMGSGQPFTIKSFFFLFPPPFHFFFLFFNLFLNPPLPPALELERCQAWRSTEKAQNTDLIRPRSATETS